MARRFDLRQLAPAGEPQSVALPAAGLPIGQLWVSASATRTLVTVRQQEINAALVWVDRHGSPLRRYSGMGPYHDLNLSHDGSRLVLDDAAQLDLWTMDLQRGVPTKMTSSPAADWVATWSPDGRTLAFSIDQDLYTMPSDGSGPPKLLRKNDVLTWVTDWSGDGRFLAGSRRSETTLWDIVLIDVNNPQAVTPVAASLHNEWQPRFSHNGQWIAYTSDESGRFEVYLQALATGAKIHVSAAGGSCPRWRADGRELFYMAPDGSLIATDIVWSQGVPRVGSAHRLFKPNHGTRSFAGTDYAPSLDGQRFLVSEAVGNSAQASLIVTLNWPELLRR
jgi:Tol biopolymer transport system component